MATVAAVRGTSVVLLGLAAWFLYGSPPAVVPRAEPTLIDGARIAPGARRRHTGEPATVIIGGFSHRCGECHRFFTSPATPRLRRVQHTQITLDHGLNSS